MYSQVNSVFFTVRNYTGFNQELSYKVIILKSYVLVGESLIHSSFDRKVPFEIKTSD